MRIFVAGATGVLGRRVVPWLVRDGHDVTAVARTAAKAAQLRVQGATPVAVDLFDPSAVRRSVDGHAVVMNVATAIPPTSQMLRRSAWRTTDRLRTEASRNLVDAVLAVGAQRYIQEALAFVYPDHGARWIDEDVEPNPPPYAAAVVAAEAQTRRVTAAGGVGIALRFAAFYAADSPQTRDMVRIARRGLLPLPGRGDGYQSWVHIDDAATAVTAVLDAPPGPYNVVEDDPLTNADHARLLGDLLDRRVRRLPAWLGLPGPLQLQARSLRVSNHRLRDATAWRATYPTRRAGWTATLSEIGKTFADA